MHNACDAQFVCLNSIPPVTTVCFAATQSHQAPTATKDTCQADIISWLGVGTSKDCPLDIRQHLATEAATSETSESCIPHRRRYCRRRLRVRLQQELEV